MKVWLTRAKFALLLGLTTVMILLHSFILILCVSVGLILLSLILSPKTNLKSRFVSIGFVAVLVILFQVAFNFALPVPVRFFVGSLVAARLIAMSLAVFLFTETTSVSEIVAALSFLPRKICLMLTISLALLPTIIHETQMIRIAQQARGFRTNNLNPIRTFLPMIIPLLHRTLTRAEHIATMLEIKGFEA